MVGLVGPVFLFTLILWAAVGAAALVVWMAASRRHRRFRQVLAQLSERSPSSTPDEIRAVLDANLGTIPPAFLLSCLAEQSSPDASARALSSWLAGRSRPQLVRYAASRNPRQARRRLSALRVLARADGDVLPLLERAVQDDNGEVVGAAVTLLGSTADVRAAESLIGALRAGRYQPSRIATALDRFPLPIPELLRSLASDANPVARFWGATLLSRYGEAEGVADEVARLVRDTDPQVRKAAVETLGTVGGETAATAALGLLGDPIWYVRAHAARALGDLGRADLAPHVVALLADPQWWVRQAAKETLEKMGPGVWRDLIKCLDHPDKFARNGAAEVLQNLGILDSLIVLEASDDHPGADKIELLRKIAAAGGLRMTNALLERTDAKLAQRIRALLDTIGLEAAGA